MDTYFRSTFQNIESFLNMEMKFFVFLLFTISVQVDSSLFEGDDILRANSHEKLIDDFKQEYTLTLGNADLLRQDVHTQTF